MHAHIVVSQLEQICNLRRPKLPLSTTNFFHRGMNDDCQLLVTAKILCKPSCLASSSSKYTKDVRYKHIGDWVWNHVLIMLNSLLWHTPSWKNDAISLGAFQDLYILFKFKEGERLILIKSQNATVLSLSLSHS